MATGQRKSAVGASQARKQSATHRPGRAKTAWRVGREFHKPTETLRRKKKASAVPSFRILCCSLSSKSNNSNNFTKYEDGIPGSYFVPLTLGLFPSEPLLGKFPIPDSQVELVRGEGPSTAWSQDEDAEKSLPWTYSRRCSGHLIRWSCLRRRHCGNKTRARGSPFAQIHLSARTRALGVNPSDMRNHVCRANEGSGAVPRMEASSAPIPSPFSPALRSPICPLNLEMYNNATLHWGGVGFRLAAVLPPQNWRIYPCVLSAWGGRRWGPSCLG